ncbi:MAG: MFS transporter [Caldilineales bacterium]|nr:MFS transporter [Caldilineales bacterium]
MTQTDYKVYRYRWVVLFAFMLVIAVNQLSWITFAPITGIAATFYGVSDLSIGLLSMSFMVVYIIFAIPASWVIDTYGIRVGVGLGAALTGVFGLMRGLLAFDYTFVLIAQIGIAIGQPFILNAITTVAARWFPVRERATASGLGSLAIYLGIVVALALTPYLTLLTHIETMLLVYGIAAVVAAIIFFVVVKERPPTSPCSPDQEERSLVFDGLKASLHIRNFILLMLIFFVGLGVFNAVTTWIEDIVRPRGFSVVQAGNIGGLMIIGGIIGALVVPILSDHVRRRTPFLLLALAGATLGLIGITFASGYSALLIASFVFGFFLLSAGPIGFQYGAEVTYPAPEGTSNGLLLLMGQVSGIAFILGMDIFKSPETGSMTMPLTVLIGLMLLSFLLCTKLRDAASLEAAS